MKINKEIVKVIYDNNDNTKVTLYEDGTYKMSSDISFDDDVNNLIKNLLDYKCVINTQTEKEAKQFVKIMRDKYNMGWYNNLDETNYNRHRKNTCYDFLYCKNDMSYCSIDYYKQDNITIIPYSEIKNLLINS